MLRGVLACDERREPVAVGGEQAMKTLIQFLEDELETRKVSLLPDTDGEGAAYIAEAEKAIADVRYVNERLEELCRECIPIVLAQEDAMRAGGIAELQTLAERFGLIEGRCGAYNPDTCAREPGEECEHDANARGLMQKIEEQRSRELPA